MPGFIEFFFLHIFHKGHVLCFHVSELLVSRLFYPLVSSFLFRRVSGVVLVLMCMRVRQHNLVLQSYVIQCVYMHFHASCFSVPCNNYSNFPCSCTQ